MSRVVEVAPERYPAWRERFDAANPDGPQRVVGISRLEDRHLAVVLIRRGGYAVAHVDGSALLKLVDVSSTEVVTPLMFEYGLLERARLDRKHIVLPEGEDDRVLRAAHTLLAREVADLTILATEKVTRKSLDDADQRRLVEQALAELDFSAIASPHDGASQN